jgi:hypothetical protein
MTTLSDLSAFEIAKRLKCGFTGDCNPIDHNGTFYDTRDWAEYGYASCVAFTRLPDEGNGATLLVECGTIHRPLTEKELLECFATCGQSGDRIGRTPEVEIECVLAHWGFEVQEDFGGPYTQQFPEDEDGCIDEDEVWQAIEGWLSGLGG